MKQKNRRAKLAAQRAKYRPSGMTRKIADALRKQIVSGTLVPGDRLPTRVELVRQFSVSPVTVQRAMQRLAAEGLVYARGKRGTRVSENLPHQTRYALVFPGHPPHNLAGHDVPRFWLTLADQTVVVAQERGLEIAVHYLTREQLDGAAGLALARQIRSHLLAGLILGGPPGPYTGTFLLQDEPSMPRVAICQPDAHFPRMGSIRLAGEQLPERAMQHLAAAGCKKVAAIANWGQGSDAFLAAAARHKLHMPAHWMQFVSINTPETAGNLTQLLMSHPDDRPDGLFIADDNLVESVTAGLVIAGVRVPADLKVLAHCNFPAATGSVLPIVRLGYDAHAVLSSAVEMIDRARAGNPPGVAEIPVIFEDETNAALRSAARRS